MKNLNWRYIVFLLIILFSAVLSLTAQAQNSIRFFNLSIKQGLSQSTVNCILQDRKGYMWFGTQDGLNLYDGYSFTVFSHVPLDTTSISDNFIHTIYEDKQGNIWIGTEQGLNKFNRDKQTFTHYQKIPGDILSLNDNNIWAICEDSNGTLWIGTDEGGLHSFNRKKGTFNHFQNTFTPEYSFSSESVHAIFEDKDKNLWIGTRDAGINMYNPKTGKFTRFLYSDKKYNTISNNTVWDIKQDKDGYLWIATNDGLNRYDIRKNEFFCYKANGPGSISNNAIRSVYIDKGGMVWAGTNGGGLNKIDPRKQTIITYQFQPNVANSLSSNNIFSIYEDQTGIIWLGTDGGINKFDRRKQNFIHYQKLANQSNSLNNNVIWSIIEDKKGNLWIGTDEGLNKFNTDLQYFIDYKYPYNASYKSIYALCEDSQGVIWAGTQEGLYLFNPAKQYFTPFQSSSKYAKQLSMARIYDILEDSKKNIWVGTKEGLFKIDPSKNRITYYLQEFGNRKSLSSSFIRKIFEDHAGNIWVGTNGGGLDKITPNVKDELEQISFYRFNPDVINSLGNNTVLAIYEDQSNFLWIGTNGGGLNRFDPTTKEFLRFTVKEGLANNVVNGILPDKSGNIWVTTNKGVSKYNIITHTFRNYEEDDGITNYGFNPGAFCRTKKGELFIGGNNGMNSFFPQKLTTNPIPPKTVITDFEIFYKPVSIGKNSPLKKHISVAKEVTLSAKDYVFSFTFAALHYSFPQRNQYMYKMEGFDEEWNMVGTTRVAPYTNMDPGEYIFRVKGSNCDGVWDEKGVAIKVTVLPPYWKTWWFRMLALAVILGSIYAWNRSRIKNIEEQKQLLEYQVQERTAEVLHQKEELEKQRDELVAEKNKSEKLLLNILPAETAEELKTKGKSSARHYRMVSVLFTDFRGFTGFAENMRPNELVAELDRCFLMFDDITEKYNIEKIKTIGDSYMCAGGIPIRNRSNPIDSVLAGLEILNFMLSLKKEKEELGESYWDIRIGIHTGDLIAGVVGKKKFAYDIWGDTVNTASRMESSGEINKVNISGATYELVKDYFVCTYRGKVLAKNKGEIDMYFVEGIQPELSVNGEGLIPNDEFKERLSKL